VGSVNAAVLLLFCLGDRRVPGRSQGGLVDALAAMPRPRGSADFFFFCSRVKCSEDEFSAPCLVGTCDAPV